MHLTQQANYSAIIPERKQKALLTVQSICALVCWWWWWCARWGGGVRIQMILFVQNLSSG